MQPFPTKPAPFDRQGMTENDVIDFTPELRKAALAILGKYNYGPLFTPPSLQKPTILMPGIASGASWAGAAFDPETGILYVPSNTIPYAVTLLQAPLPHADYIGALAAVETMQGIPIWKPPYGRITAIDMNTGDHRWMSPLGDLAQSNPALKQLELPPLGRPARGHVLLTKTLLIVGQEGTTRREESAGRESGFQRGVTAGMSFEVHDPKLVAYDKATGRLVGEVVLLRNTTGAPMRPAPEAVFTIAPPPCFSMWAISYFMHNHTPLRLMARMRSQLSSVSSTMVLALPAMPALLCAQSNRP